MRSASLYLGLVALLVADVATASPRHHRSHHARHHVSPRAHRASAAPPAVQRASYFLGGNPHVPLAVVAGNAISDAVTNAERGHTCGARSRWRVPASRWNAIDAWGQVVGAFTVDDFDDYDVTGCAEAAFSNAPRNDGALVFASVDSAWRPAPSVRWMATAAEQHGFDAVLSDAVRGHVQKNLPRACAEVADETRFFEIKSGNATQRFAVGGRAGGYVVASFANGNWTRELVKTMPVASQSTTFFSDMCYRPVAVFDMNGDGVPEIIMREAEPQSWGDFVLSRSASGHWRVMATSPGGSTA